MKHLEPNRLILIGASTGGPRDIKNILKSISQEFRSSIIIAQHMGDEYMESFASHMSSNTHLKVKVAQDGEFLQCQTVYIASKICHVVKNRESLSFKITTSKEENYNPNINELFISCSHFSKNMDVLACILTGIGDDGAKGMLALSKTGSVCLSESKESAAVYGMPLRAQEVSKKVKVQSLNEIIKTINSFGA